MYKLIYHLKFVKMFILKIKQYVKCNVHKFFLNKSKRPATWINYRSLIFLFYINSVVTIYKNMSKFKMCKNKKDFIS